MNLAIRIFGVGLAVMLISCKPHSTSSSAGGMSPPEVKSKLLGITGLAVPDTSTHVSGVEASMFTYVFDCTFDCTLADLRGAWENSPKLVEKVPFSKLATSDKQPAKIFDEHWPANGGTQFVQISLAPLDEERVRVEIRTVHEGK